MDDSRGSESEGLSQVGQLINQTSFTVLGQALDTVNHQGGGLCICVFVLVFFSS
jgi:hypothetical protein